MDVLGTLLLVTPSSATQRALGQTLEKLGWRVLLVETLAGVAPTLEQQTSAPDAICVMPSSAETLDDITLLLEQCRSQQPKMLRVLADAPPSPPIETLIALLNRARPHHYLTAPLDLWKLQHALQETLGERTVSDDERQVLAAYRRRREQKHIADTTIEVVTRPDGVRVIVPSPRLAVWERPEAVPATPASESDPSPHKLLHDLVALLVRQPRVTLRLEPRGGSYALLSITEHGERTLAVVPSGSGEAVTHHLARLCEVDLTAIGERAPIGMVRAEVGGVAGRILGRFAGSALGWTVECSRLLDWRELDEIELLSRPKSHEYRFLGIVAENAMAVTYRALDVTLERHALVKMLRHPASADPIAAARLLRQARAEGRIAHVGVVQLLDYGSLPDGRPFVAHELIEWPSLRTRLLDGRIGIGPTLEIVSRLLPALGAAHQADVVHRGLTPENILVSDDHEIKIADFGSARLLYDRGPKLTVAGSLTGDPHYLAPEQIGDSSAIDGRTDLYALACIAWEMLSGSPPFVADDPWQVIAQHQSERPPRLEVDGKALPAALEAMLRSWLAKRPDSRPQLVEAGRAVAELRDKLP